MEFQSFVTVQTGFCLICLEIPIKQTCLCNMQQLLKAAKMIIFRYDIFLIFAQNIDCGYSLGRF